MKKLFPIVVNYSKSLADMIQFGNYDWVDSDISEDHFPVKNKGQAELNIKLVRYDKLMKSAAIIRDLDNNGLRPATLPELLAFGATYPNEQRRYDIVALGSVWRRRPDCHDVVYLFFQDIDRAVRGLSLRIWGWGLLPNECIAAVRK